MYKKSALWSLLTLPGVALVFAYVTDAITYGETIHWSGQLSVGLLLLAMAATPLKTLSLNWSQKLLQIRRPVGVASFGYAALHTVVYLAYKWGSGLISKEGLEVELATGWVALAIFFVLALTSNAQSVRMLRTSWQPLHRLIYLAAALTFAHWLLASFFPTAAFICLTLLVLLQGLRLR